MSAPSRALTGSSLVDPKGLVWLPYDLPPQLRQGEWRPLHEIAPVWHARYATHVPDFPAARRLAVLNGMGVALGDSIVGLGCLHGLKRLHPHLEITLYRSRRAAPYIEELYACTPWLDDVRYLPVHREKLQAGHDLVIDVGDVMFWPQFAALSMVDFFLWTLGIDPHGVPVRYKQNRWLAELAWPRPDPGYDYVLFLPESSNALRTMPEEHWCDAVERIWRSYRLPVHGAVHLDHPHYRCSFNGMETTAEFIGWIAGAKTVVSVDSSAVHIAAGFDVPTLAFFTSIDPKLRIACYPRCKPVDLCSPAARGLHSSEDRHVLAAAALAWRSAFASDWAWPALADAVELAEAAQP